MSNLKEILKLNDIIYLSFVALWFSNLNINHLPIFKYIQLFLIILWFIQKVIIINLSRRIEKLKMELSKI
jgi:hypothetical protein